MKTVLTFLCLCISLCVAFAGSPLQPASRVAAYEHLTEVNKQWLKHEATAPQEKISFATDIDRIQYHLLNVEQHLRNNTPENLTEEGIRNRPRLLDALHMYATQKTFPTNTRHAARTPYFIDDFNVYCAVGYLISVSGYDALARNINREHRYDYIHDIQTNGLVAWSKTFGFTVDELAWIQPAYSPATQFAPLQAGTDGPVNNIIVDYTGNGIVFSGIFHNVNNMPCSNIGRFKNNQLECVGNGLPGTVNDILNFSTGLTETMAAVGEYGNATTYPIAKFDGTTWNYETINGMTTTYVGHKVFYGGAEHQMEVVVSNMTTPNQHEIWYQMNNGTWEKQATVNGIINDIEASGLGRVYAGAFESVVVHKPSGDETVTAHNVVVRDNGTDDWAGIGTELSDEVFVVRAIGSALYIGGVCGPASQSDVCLTRYLNGTLQPLVMSNMFSDTVVSSISDIELKDDGLLIGGKFDMYNQLISGRNLASLDLVNNYLVPLASLNDRVTSIAGINGEWIIGGNFTMNEVLGQNLPHLARIDQPNSIRRVGHYNSFQVFPNPADNLMVVDAADRTNIETLNVTDMLGRKLMEVDMSQKQLPYTLDVSTLSNGTYMISTESAEGRAVKAIQVSR